MRNSYSKLFPVLSSIVILLTAACGTLKSQNYTTIGSDTFSITGNNATPYSTSYDDGRHMYLILASELGATGAVGNIVSIGWDVASLAAQPLHGFQIKISTTPFTVLPATFPTATTTVYAPSTIVQPALGWNQYAFTIPYIWNGIDNLIVQVCYDNVLNSNVNYGVKGAYQSGYSRGVVANNSSGCSLTSTYPANWRPNIRFEFPEYSNDAGVTELINPVFPTCAMDSLVKVKIKNFGADSLTSLNVNWSVNGVLQAIVPYSNSSGLPPLTIDTLTLGTVAGGLTDGDSILVWGSLPNGVLDSNNLNDTLLSLVHNSMSGTYVIDPTGSGDFTSFNSAVVALSDFGVCGPTIFEAVDGTYNEQISLINFVGMDTVNTVTFRSQSGIRDNVVLQYTSVSNSGDYVIKLFDADNFVFEDMTIWALSTVWGHGIHIWDADNFTIDNCVIKTNSVTNGEGIYAYYYNSGTYASCDNFKVTNCMFEGGYYNLYYVNYCNGRAQVATIEKNEFTNARYYGAYISCVDNLQFNGNYAISNTPNSSPFNHAFYIQNVTNGSISSNYVEGSMNWPRTGLATNNVQGDLNAFMPIVNNRIYMPNPVADNGIYSNNCLFTEYAYNSVFIEGDSMGRAFYLNNGAYNNVKNNIFQITGIGHAFYLQGSGVYQMDYNNLSAPNGDIGYASGGQSTLGDWQSATGYDTNSVTVNNTYSNPVTLMVCTDFLYEKGEYLPAYGEDFEGDLRQVIPCIGADEFMPISQIGFDNPMLCYGDTLILQQDYFDTVVWNTNDTSSTIMVTAPGPNSVAVYGECGSDTFNFTVNSPVQAFIGDTNLCEGTNAVLETGIPNGTYLWSNGSTDSTNMVNSAQVVSVEVIDEYGCSSTDTAIITQSYNVNLPDSTFFCEGLSIDLDANINGAYMWSTGDTSQVLTVSTAGVYSVTVVDQNCLSADSSWVSENLNASACFSTWPDHMTVSFSNYSLNADAYLWDFGDGTTSTDEHSVHVYPWTPLDSVNYTVTLIAFNSCSLDSAVNTSVKVGSPYYGGIGGPYVSYINAQVSGWNVMFNSGNNLTGGTQFWNFGDGNTASQENPTHLYSSMNPYECYTVSLVMEGCALDSVEIDIAAGSYPSNDPCDIIDGVNDLSVVSNIEIYPNPNTGVFMVSVKTEEVLDMQVEVMDMRGAIIYSKSFGKVSGDAIKTITMGNAASGIYLVKVILNGETAVYRLLVK